MASKCRNGAHDSIYCSSFPPMLPGDVDNDDDVGGLQRHAAIVRERTLGCTFPTFRFLYFEPCCFRRWGHVETARMRSSSSCPRKADNCCCAGCDVTTGRRVPPPNSWTVAALFPDITTAPSHAAGTRRRATLSPRAAFLYKFC